MYIYISTDSLNKLYKLMESFFEFQFRFRIIGRKPKNIQTASILIKDSKCNADIMHQ